MGLKKTNAANIGKKKRKKIVNCMDDHLSEKSKKSLNTFEVILGKLVSDFIRDRLQNLSESLQSKFIWHILHYMYSDEVLPTGNLDIDTKLIEVVEILPLVNIEVFRYLTQLKYGRKATLLAENTLRN